MVDVRYPRVERHSAELEGAADDEEGVALRIAQASGNWPGDPNAEANVLLAYVLGRWHQFAKSGFKRGPQDGWDEQRRFLFG